MRALRDAGYIVTMKMANELDNDNEYCNCNWTQ